ncbi:MAG: class I lanthipeptide [Dysgonamonadaceae bacterium]|jgi:hypothetical protein|nr:class I lanthipeptide [Dysgonamonadaceae bacterium]
MVKYFSKSSINILIELEMKKLTLKKEVVSILNGNEMNQVKGGGTFDGLCYSDLPSCVGCQQENEYAKAALATAIGITVVSDLLSTVIKK